jgi:hypothetical protein
MLFAVPHSPSPSQSSPRPTDRQLAMFGLLGHSDGPTATRQSPQLWPASHLPWSDGSARAASSSSVLPDGTVPAPFSRSNA